MEIPVKQVTPELISEWYDLQKQLGPLKAKEMLLRKAIFGGLFPNPVEGTNTYEMLGGWKAKGKRVIERKIDLPVLQSMAVLGGPLHQAGIRADDYVKWEPDLKLKEYRTLTAEQKLVFDQCLIIKDGAPGLELVPPKEQA